MKKLFLMLSVLSLLFVSCAPVGESEIDKFFDGKHLVEKFRFQNDKVVFLWTNSNDLNTYETVIPTEKLRIIYEETESPYVKFRWKVSGCEETNKTVDELMDENLVYAEFHFRDNTLQFNYDNSNKDIDIVDSDTIEKSPTDVEIENEYEFYTDKYDNYD